MASQSQTTEMDALTAVMPLGFEAQFPQFKPLLRELVAAYNNTGLVSQSGDLLPGFAKRYTHQGDEANQFKKTMYEKEEDMLWALVQWNRQYNPSPKSTVVALLGNYEGDFHQTPGRTDLLSNRNKFASRHRDDAYKDDEYENDFQQKMLHIREGDIL